MDVPGKVAVRQEVVDEASLNQRLDNFLLKVLKGVPKSHVYRLLRRGEVRVNGHRAQPDQRLALDDRVRIPPVRVGDGVTKPARDGNGEPSLLDAHILFEDDWLLVLDKPSGWAVHGGSGVSRGVIEQLRAERPAARFLELVHRLDRDTSGLLLVAKKRSALTGLHADLREGRITKHYQALAHGTWRKGRRVVDAALQSTMVAPSEKRMRVDDGGISATTVFTPLATWKGFSLLDAHLLTGRTHQIRVHLTHIGHPILGDDKYGDPERDKPLKRLGVRRLMLHAFRLAFTHPESGKALTLEAPLPDDFAGFVAQLDARAEEERALRRLPGSDAPAV
ncbi:MAG: RluA family pseudouridine synthase [Proteobacteria bacterium]|nr:RluA family pseudouridine synthase [Burkholderiales bacterium]